MDKKTILGVIFLVIPILSFVVLACIHPVGDPQDSNNLFIKILDYQGTYWLRMGRPLPPPFLLAGTVLLLWRWLFGGNVFAKIWAITGMILMVTWFFVWFMPIVIHVN